MLHTNEVFCWITDQTGIATGRNPIDAHPKHLKVFSAVGWRMRQNAHPDLIADFTSKERRFLRSLNTPAKIQDFLDKLPTNHEPDGDTCKSPLRVLRDGHAHCIEAAMLAALCLRLLGQKALLIDLTSDRSDQDHVLAVFKEHGCWGAIAKSNHHALGYRDPIYRTLRELTATYVHEYLNYDGKKTLRSWAGPLDLKRFDNSGWTNSEKDLWFVPQALISIPHHDFMTRQQAKRLRPADQFQRAMSNVKRDNPDTLRVVPFTRSAR